MARNIGASNAPEFDVPSFVQSGPTGAKTDIDIGARATPTVADWNNDGRLDLVIGGLDGRVRLFLNYADAGPPDLRESQVVQDGAADLLVASGRSSVEVIDFDGDGRKDLVTGNTDGELLFYRNIGADAEPQFAGAEPVEAEGAAINLAGTPRSRPFVGVPGPSQLPAILIGADDGLVHWYSATSWQTGVEQQQDSDLAGNYVFRFESPQSQWQNLGNVLDVDGDGTVASTDVLLVINELNGPQWHDEVGYLPPPTGSVTAFFDADGDGFCTPLDALRIINHLNASADAGEGEDIAYAYGLLDSGYQSAEFLKDSPAKCSESLPLDGRVAWSDTEQTAGSVLPLADDLQRADLSSSGSDELEPLITELAQSIADRVLES